MKFRNRTHAGQMLAERLVEYRDEQNLIVLALPRGGVPVAYEVAKTLGCHLDVFLVRKLGVPGQEELAMGAITNGGGRVLDEQLVEILHIPKRLIDLQTEREEKELQRREQVYRQNRPPLRIEGQTVIVVDDGLATGSTMLAATRSIRAKRPAKIIAAVPVAPSDTCAKLQKEVDDIVCLYVPREPFVGVGLWYEDFTQTTDTEVLRLLSRAA